MKAHSQDFKDKIKLIGRQLDSKITYTIDDEEIELGKEELNSITPHYQGSLLKSVMKQLDIDSNVDIPLGTEVNYQLGLKLRSGKNIFDDSSKNNKWLTVQGVIDTSQGANLLKIPCSSGDTFSLSATFESASGSTIILIAFFDENDNMLLRNAQAQSTNPSLTRTAPSNTAYMLAGHYVTEPLTIQLEKGQATDYEPYGMFDYLDYGNYIVYSSEKQEDTRSYKIVCYDKMLYSMVDYKGLIGISFPMTIRDYIGHIADLMNIPFKNENDTFTNYDRILQTDPYVQINDDDGSIQPMDYTIRDVLDELSQVTASTICITDDDELELRDINITDTNADFEIEGSTTQDGTPTPDNPIPVINKTGEIEEEINGELRKINLGSVELCGINDYKDKLRRSQGKNRYNNEISSSIRQYHCTTSYVDGEIIISATGTDCYFGEVVNTGGSWNNTYGELILAKPNTKYSFKTTNDLINKNYVTYYNESKVSLGTSSLSNFSVFTTPNNTKYIQFRIGYGSSVSGTNYKTNIMLVEGQYTSETIPPYEPYYPKGTWYKKSEIGKYTLEPTDFLRNTSDVNTIGKTNVLDNMITSAYLGGYCDYWKFESQIWSTGQSKIGFACLNGMMYMSVSGNYASTNDLQTYLATLFDECHLYMPLIAPTYEIITDTTAISSLNDTGLDEIDEEYLKDVNVKFGEKYGPVNSLVLSRSANSDNIYRKDNESIVENGLCELRIADNLILNNNDRDEYIDAIFDKVKGLEYFVNDYSSTGVCYYDLLDRYDVKVEGNHYPCIMLNDEINVTQGLVEEIHADALEHSETDYTKADKTDRKINQTTLIVDKQNGIITAKVEALDKNYQDLNNNLYGENGDIAKLGTRIDQKVDSITFNTYKERIDNGDVVIDNTMVLINDEGINVSTDDSKISTQITNNAFEIKDSSGTELAFFGYDETENTSKSQFDNLNITRYLTAGNHRIEKCGNYMERTGWFYIGGSQ